MYSQETTPASSELNTSPKTLLESRWTVVSGWGLKHRDSDCGLLEIFLQGRSDDFDNGMVGQIKPHQVVPNAKMATIMDVHLADQNRGQGLGFRMLLAFTRLSMEHGATHLGGVNPSPAAIQAYARVFGSDRIQLYDRISEESGGEDEDIATEQRISLDEAVERTERRAAHDAYITSLWQKHKDPVTQSTEAERRQLDFYRQGMKSFSVVVDLRGLDTAAWESDMAATVTS